MLEYWKIQIYLGYFFKQLNCKQIDFFKFMKYCNVAHD